MIKTVFTLLALSLSIGTISAQSHFTPRLFYHDAKGKSVSKKKAKFLGVLKPTNDSSWEYAYYHIDGPLITISTYKDEAITKRHGYHAYFDELGRIDSAGIMTNGARDSIWSYYNNYLELTESRTYENGKMISATPRSFKQKVTDVKGPSFPGGASALSDFLRRNLLFPVEMKAPYMAEVITRFDVAITGKTGNYTILQSAGYLFDQASLDCISRMPDWVPATQNDQPVPGQVRQPLTFKSF